MTDLIQRLADTEFVEMVAHLMDLAIVADLIVTLHGGWDE